MSPLHASSYEPAPWGRRIGLAFLGLVALAVAGYVGSVVGPHFKTTSSSGTTTTTAPASTTTSTVPHSTVKVLVANGTSEANAAAHFAQQLQQQGWNVAQPTNTTTPATATTIYYAPSQQQAAEEIATELGVAKTSVQPLSTSVPVASAGGNDVVVVIGPDLAGNGFPATTTT